LAHPLGSNLSDFLPLNPSERDLIDACRIGEVADFGAQRPRRPDVSNKIRAEIVRFLALGGDVRTPVHTEGVRIQGAWIEGDINLQSVDLKYPLVIWDSTIDGDVLLFDAHIRHLNLGGSQIRSLRADRLHCSGGVFLRHGFEALGCIRLSGARIGGDADFSRGDFWEASGLSVTLEGANVGGSIHFSNNTTITGRINLSAAFIRGRVDFSGATFLPVSSFPIFADGLEVVGDFSMSNGFSCTGELRFFGAKFGQSVDLSGGSFRTTSGRAISFDRACIAGSVFLRSGFQSEGEVRFCGAQISNDFDAAGGIFNFYALSKESKDVVVINLERAIVKGAVLFFKGCKIFGKLNLSSSTFGMLCHAREAWPRKGDLFIDGAKFGVFTSTDQFDANEAIDWLQLQPDVHLGREFRPQPWEHLANVLMAVGHESDAKLIQIEKRRRMRWRNFKVAQGQYRKFKAAIGGLGDTALDLFVGYGYRPWRAAVALLAIWILGAVVFSIAGNHGIMAPSDTKLYLDGSIPSECREDWINFSMRLNRKSGAAAEDELVRYRQLAGLPLGHGRWEDICPRLLPAEYSTFHPVAYSLDIVLPLVDLRQERDWAPRVSDGNGNTLLLGHIVRFWEWVQIIAGWGLSLLLVAAVSGVVRRD